MPDFPLNLSRKGKQLGQLRPADTNAASIYSPASGVDTEILLIQVCNTTGSTAAFRLFHDDDGTTYDESTALEWDKPVPGTNSVLLSYEEGSGIWMSDDTGNLAVRSDTISALTFTVYGKEDVS